MQREGLNIKSIVAEFLGSFLLATTVVGSGIMATNLTNDAGVQLVINAIATVFILYTIISALAQISGAHFNPAVTLSFLIDKQIELKTALSYWFIQIFGCIAGVITANIMFNLKPIEISEQIRSGPNLLISEVVATTGLVLIIHLLIKQKRTSIIPACVALWIGSAYFFTASTSFANPAITVARSLTNSFAGISPSSVSLFIVSQLFGAFLGLLISWLIGNKVSKNEK